MTELTGVLAALATPMDAQQEIDEARLREHVDFVIDGGVHGLVPCGSTGEFAALGLDERRRVVEIVAEQHAGRVALVPQTGALATRDAVALTRHAAEHGADSTMIVTPFYEAPTRSELIEYFGTLADAVDLPLMAYNIPDATGVNLDLEFYRDLGERTTGYRYVKDASGDMAQAMSLLRNLSGELGVMIGMDTIMLPVFAMGAVGTVWGAPNYMPRECVRLWEDVQAGRLEEARAGFAAMLPVLELVTREGYAVDQDRLPSARSGPGALPGAVHDPARRGGGGAGPPPGRDPRGPRLGRDPALAADVPPARFERATPALGERCSIP